MTLGAADAIFPPRQYVHFIPGRLPRMSVDLGEFFASVEEEFDVAIDGASAPHMSPLELVDYIVEHMPEPGERMDDDERRDYVDSVLGELMAQVLGITRYDEATPFAQIVQHARRR